MANDKVALANIALAKLGASRISSFNDDSDEARVINDVYKDILGEVLAEGPWSFALKRVLLTLSADEPAFTNDGLSVVYTKPNDLVRVFFTSTPNAVISVEGNRILSDTSQLGIKYVFFNDNPASYYPMFTTALATRLAAEIGFNLTESVKKAEALFSEYEKIRLPRALGSDAQQGTPTQPIQNEWEGARLTGSNAFVIQPNAQTWYPV